MKLNRQEKEAVNRLIDSVYDEQRNRIVGSTMARIIQAEAFRRDVLEAANRETAKQRRMAEQYRKVLISAVSVLGVSVLLNLCQWWWS